jgi:hypothetical protein
MHLPWFLWLIAGLVIGYFIGFAGGKRAGAGTA